MDYKKSATRFVHSSIFSAPDDKLLEFPTVGIAYGSNTYACNLEYIDGLKECIKQDYPDIADKDIEVWFIDATYSNIHRNQTMLKISIPTEEFIRLREADEIHLL